ncbi:hypothetical protein MRX96_058303 [Rhipicephalus microplus]
MKVRRAHQSVSGDFNDLVNGVFCEAEAFALYIRLSQLLAARPTAAIPESFDKSKALHTGVPDHLGIDLRSEPLPSIRARRVVFPP